MKKNIITILLIFIIPLTAYAIMNCKNGSSIGSADAKTNRPQIVKFTSAMCLDCQEMTRIMKELYPKYQSRVDMTEINVQDGNKKKNDEWINKYHVNLVPTIILINSEGGQVKRIEGAIPKEEMDKYLRELK